MTYPHPGKLRLCNLIEARAGGYVVHLRNGKKSDVIASRDAAITQARREWPFKFDQAQETEVEHAS